MNIAIVANGQLDESLLPVIRQADYSIGVDRAAYWLLQHKATPDIAVGDFDSTSPTELSVIKNQVETIQEPAHPKDKTDLEMAVHHAISLKPKQVVMYGATGSRIDQTLGAINLLEQFLKANIQARMRDSHNEIFLLRSAQTIAQSPTYKYFSVLAHTQKTVVSIRGALYPLNTYTLHRDVSLGISNEITAAKATITVHSGIAVIIQSRD